MRVVGPVGLTMERTEWRSPTRTPEADVTRLVRASADPARGAVIPTTVLAAGAALPTRVSLEYRAVLTGADLRGLVLAGGRQEFSGDTLIVRRESTTALVAAFQLPAREPRFAPWLEPEPLIQSGDPAIRTAAHQILGDETDPARAAERLTHWVAANVRKEAGVGMPNAVRVLRQRRGDCNEFTVLYVALARAAGLPARSVAGLLESGGRFYYDAWPEVPWDVAAVDPLLDQFPADAAHLRFAVGSWRATSADSISTTEGRGSMIRLSISPSCTAVSSPWTTSHSRSRRVSCSACRPNVATPTLRMMAGILRPNGGRGASGDDVHANPIAAKQQLGFNPDRPFVYDKLTGAEFLSVCRRTLRLRR